MSVYPQFGSGAVAQFPLSRTRTWRVISNDLESGERVMLADSAGGQVLWKLSYQDLTDAETANLTSLFGACQGGYSPFTFIDPLANLLGWSEKLSQAGWQTGLLQIQGGAGDPLGTTRASAVTNASGGAQAISQTIGVPGPYVACFSVWLRSDTAGVVAVQRDSVQVMAAVTPNWNQVFVSGTGIAGAGQSTFSISIAAGQSVDVWGMQAEVQPWPSSYKVTSASIGIYTETYFATDRLSISSQGPGRSSCDIQLISRV